MLIRFFIVESFVKVDADLNSCDKMKRTALHHAVANATNDDMLQIIEQIIRPTGLLDPVCEIRSAKNQVADLVEEVKKMFNIPEGK